MATDISGNKSFDPAETEVNKYDFKTPVTPVFKTRKGLDREIVAQISEMKQEPGWMRDFRLQSLDIFESKPMPHWGGAIDIDFQDIYYYLKPTDQQGKAGTIFLKRSKKPLTAWAFPRPKRNFSPA